MNRRFLAGFAALGAAAVWTTTPGAQGQKKADWLADGGDPQRTAWQRNETILTKDNVKDMKLLWKLKLDNETRQMHSLFPPLIAGSVTTAAGPREIAVVAGVSDNVFGIDVEKGALLWSRHFDSTVQGAAGRAWWWHPLSGWADGHAGARTAVPGKIRRLCRVVGRQAAQARRGNRGGDRTACALRSAEREAVRAQPRERRDLHVDRKYHINYSASPPPVKGGPPECPGGLTASLSRPTAIAPAAIGTGGFGGGRGGRSGGGVGEPGRGALTLASAGQARGGGAAAPGGRGAAPAEGAPGAAPGSAAAAAGVAPGGLPGGARAGGPGGGGGGRGGPFVPGDDAAYVVGSDGYLHALNVQNGWENMTPVLFLPANTRATGLIVATSADGSAVAYAATTHGCGSQPDGVWALDLGSAQKVVTAFRAKGATIAGNAGPAIGRDGTVYVATADGKSPMSNAIIALEPKTLKLKGSVTGTRGPRSRPRRSSSRRRRGSSPPRRTRTSSSRPAAANCTCSTRAFWRTDQSRRARRYAPPDSDGSALATWQDAQGTRWIATTSARGIVAMKVAEQDGKLTLAPGWTSREIGAPLAPVVVNGVLFAGSAGARAVPGALYAMDAATGKELWNSGKSITSTVQSGLSAGQGNVYVPGADGTLYAFGFAIEK